MTELKLKAPVTKEEYEVYKRYFKALDMDRTKVVTAEAAKPFLEQSGLSGRQLGQIWSLVDLDGKGFLIFREFCALVRIISHLLETPSLPLTSSLYATPANKMFQATVPDRKKQRAANRIKSTPLPLLTTNDTSRFSQLFERTTGQEALLPGDKARDIFVKANLPTEVLGDIWFLCDREKDGCLDKYEFIMAMHLIGLRLASNPLMNPVPKRISRKLWESAGLKLNRNSTSSLSSASVSSRPSSTSSYSLSRTSSHRSVPSSRRSSRQFSPTLQQNGIQRTESPVITRTLSGSSSTSPHSSTSNLASFTPLDSPKENSWIIQQDQFKNFQASFLSLDKEQTRQLGPHILVPFFMKSGLTRETLANVWDLADMNKTGTLNELEFIVAMFLIQRIKVTRSALPFKIPQELLESVTNMATQSMGSPLVVTTSNTGLGISTNSAKSPVQPAQKKVETPRPQPVPEEVVQKIHHKKDNLAKLNKQIAEANGKLTQLQVKEPEYEEELRELEDIEESLIIKLNGINNSIQQATSKSEKLEQSIATVKKNSEQLKQQLTVAEGNYHAMDAKVNNLDEDLQDCISKNKQLQSEIGNMQSMTASLQPKLLAKQEEIKTKLQELNLSNKDLELEKITVQNLQAELNDLDNAFEIYKANMPTPTENEPNVEDNNSNVTK
ncbi:hypothetical protein C6P44_003694 [Monosporozyma unispora]|nr:hypothetical protein C6P44_003694 [Kazachstania unispora]